MKSFPPTEIRGEYGTIQCFPNQLSNKVTRRLRKFTEPDTSSRRFRIKNRGSNMRYMKKKKLIYLAKLIKRRKHN